MVAPNRMLKLSYAVFEYRVHYANALQVVDPVVFT